LLFLTNECAVRLLAERHRHSASLLYNPWRILSTFWVEATHSPICPIIAVSLMRSQSKNCARRAVSERANVAPHRGDHRRRLLDVGKPLRPQATQGVGSCKASVSCCRAVSTIFSSSAIIKSVAGPVLPRKVVSSDVTHLRPAEPRLDSTSEPYVFTPTNTW